MSASGLSCGFVGLPNVGKSTLFNAVTASRAPAANYPFCTIDPNSGTVEVIDPRLEILSKMSNSTRIIYATTEFVDIAGLVEGASKGEGLGNAFLSHIRATDAIVHVVRCFDSSDVIHVKGRVDPIEDIEIINLELILADLASCENSLAKVEKQLKTKKELQPVAAALAKVRDHLNKNLPVRSLVLTSEEKAALEQYPFLTQKKMLYAANVSEESLPSMENEYVQKVREYAHKEGSEVIPICAKLEEEIAQLPASERQEFLQSLGFAESGLQRLVKSAFEMLGLLTFITTGEIETRAWTITQGSTAVEAAGKIHTDIQKGFIRAEVVTFDDFVHYDGRVGAKAAGKARAEGREYIVKDGDIVLFLHSN
ncbi:MAG: redox-regulated ATPase YchF [Verrucomicrobia bacterium]|nr:redox-regulated ATPase YchF [Verrucomicrobiota bacterium]